MPRTRDEGRVEQARLFASQGMTVTRIAMALGVSRRTVQRWGITAPPGRQEVADEDASPRTARRRRAGG